MNQENKNLRGPEYYANDDECHGKANEGYIYILTNPSFPNYVKLSYADDVEKRRNLIEVNVRHLLFEFMLLIRSIQD